MTLPKYNAIVECYCCGYPCLDWDSKEMFYTCLPCAKEVHIQANSSIANLFYEHDIENDDRWGDGFDNDAPKWIIALDEVRAKHRSPTSVDNYTCKRCSNKKLNKTEKSCWSCGEAINA